MKYFRMSYDEVVRKRSYINIILLNRAIPGIKPFDERKNEQGDTAAAPTAQDEDDINEIARFAQQQERKQQRSGGGGTRYKNMDELFMSLM